MHSRLTIIGSGPAGCTAALYAARANLKPRMITGFARGGQLMTTTDVENWPGDSLGVQGPQLMTRLAEHAERFGTEMIVDQITSVDLRTSPLVLRSAKATYTCDALIVAMGASAMYLGLPSEQAYLGRGVSGCATCDGFFYKDENVCVVGGGNTAIEEALYLSNIASHVTIIHRRNRFRAEAVLVARVLALEKAGRVTIAYEAVLDEVLGDADAVTAARLRNVRTGIVSGIDVRGVFIAIGHQPNTDVFKGQLDMTANGYIVTRAGTNGGATSTSVPGVFAAGDVQDHVYRQAVTSAGTGCMAALDAEKYLAALPVTASDEQVAIAS